MIAHIVPNAVNTSVTSCVMSNCDKTSANDSPSIDSGESGMTLGVGVGVAVGVGVGDGVAVGPKVMIGLGLHRFHLFG
jgi:hypothetical protein